MKRELTPIEARIWELGILPVVAIDNAEDAVPMANALSKGVLPCAEITFRTEAAAEAIRRIRENCPSVLCGAGTVLTIGQLHDAAKAGAQFVVTPGFQPKIVEAALAMKMPVFPGCATPSDVETALAMGLNTVKFFPAEAAGGVKMIKALSAPYGNVRFMPTGGISPANMEDYLSFPKVFACGGSWMVKKDLIQAGAFDRITELCRQAVQKKEEIRSCQK